MTQSTPQRRGLPRSANHRTMARDVRHVHDVRFDEMLVPGAVPADLSAPLWMRLVPPQMKADPGLRQRFLRLAGFMLPEEGVLRPTVAGVLTAAEDPAVFLPNARTVVEWTLGGIGVSRDIRGPLDRQILEACRTVEDTVPGAYAPEALFEAVVNAAVHRDWSEGVEPVRIRIFRGFRPDRLEITSPGLLTGTMTVESLPFRTAVRNRLLVSLLTKVPLPEVWAKRLGRNRLIETRGEGVGTIIRATEALAGCAPVWKMVKGDGGPALRLTIPPAPRR